MRVTINPDGARTAHVAEYLKTAEGQAALRAVQQLRTKPMTPPELPEWPEKPYRGAGFGELYQYWKEQSDAALARMEALKEVLGRAIEALERADLSDGWCMCGSAVLKHSTHDNHAPTDSGEYYKQLVLAEANELLAACERGSGG